MRINGQYVLVHLPVRRMSKSTSRESLAALTLGAMGVVYGDIGTSPLYTMKEVFSPATGIPLDQAHLIGAVSVIFWGLMMVVTLKYVMLILRADNRGEGGIMALTALAVEAVGAKPGKRLVLLLLGVFGAALFYGDSVITPAESGTGSVAAKSLFDQLRALPAVETAKLDLDWIRKLESIIAIGQKVVLGLVILLSTGVLLIIGNTIRLAVESRRQEILVTRLVGGTDAFVRRRRTLRRLGA